MVKAAVAPSGMSLEVAAILRFKSVGIDAELGRLHDLTCPAYHPDEVAKYHPFADFRSVIDEAAFQRKAVEAACGPDIGRAMAARDAWQAAVALKGADPADLNTWRLELHKAFRDANPGPSSAPTPGSISPQRYNRPLITDGHEAASTGHDGPNSSPQVATSAPNAHSFDRPPLAAGHQSPSPSFMKQGGGEYPAMQGVPVQLNYAHIDKERARMALVRMHDQLSRQFPEVCPLDSPDARPLRAQQPEGHPVPPVAGIGKGDGFLPKPREGFQFSAGTDLNGVPSVPVDAPPVAAAFKADPETGDFFADADVYKSFKKMRKKLGKKVLAGKITVDEARAKMGRQFAQKGGGDEAAVQKSGLISLPLAPSDPAKAPQIPVPTPLAVKSATTDHHVLQPLTVDPAAFTETFEAALTKAVAPLAAELTSTKALLAEQQEAFTSKLADQQRVIDAIADQPDPSTAAFSGVALNPLHKAARPAGVQSIAEGAERAQQMIMRELSNQYNSASDPAQREAAYASLCKMRGVNQ
jgi:hypothetical protein